MITQLIQTLIFENTITFVTLGYPIQLLFKIIINFYPYALNVNLLISVNR